LKKVWGFAGSMQAKTKSISKNLSHKWDTGPPKIGLGETGIGKTVERVLAAQAR